MPLTPFAPSARRIARPTAVRPSALVPLLLVAWPVVGAAQPPGVGTSRQPLIASTAVTLQEQTDKGLVQVALPGGTCSGVLVGPAWVLTAGHCIDPARQPGTHTVTWLANARTSDAFYQFGGGQCTPPGPATAPCPAPTWLDLASGPDLALIHVTPDFPAQPKQLATLLTGDPANLRGRTIATYGVGISNYYAPGPPPVLSAPTGYRAADLTVGSVGGDTVSFTAPATTDPVTGPGDSGGPGFLWLGGRRYLATITSRGRKNCVNPTTPVTCNRTITRIAGATMTSVPATAAYIRAVLSTRWSPAATSQPVWVQAGEIAGGKWPVTDVNTAGWAAAARAATAMCYHRGLAVGHFDGHQDVATGGFGIQCTGAIGGDARFFDVPGGAGPWAVADVNAVRWAQAHRKAQDFCAAQGVVGGIPTGHLIAGRMGVVCVRAGASRTDLLRSRDLHAWPIGVDINAVPWAQARWAAVEFCRGRGGASGGILHGHQIGDHVGVVCLR